MLLKTYNSDFVFVVLNNVVAHEMRNNRALMKNSEVDNKYRNKYKKIKTILSNFYFKHKRFPGLQIIKHKVLLCAQGVI